VQAPDLILSRSLRLALLLAAVVVLSVLATIGTLFAAGLLGVPTRQEQVATRGASVMPFDLDATTHVFQPQPDGGLQQVVAKNPADAEQIALIRQHLQHEAAKFARGDFADPAAIHGEEMPGLAALRESAGRIDIAYSELVDGAQIRYTTSDPALVTALHQWFAAQLSDHGIHATDQMQH
jgi:hypothetical protein